MSLSLSLLFFNSLLFFKLFLFFKFSLFFFLLSLLCKSNTLGFSSSYSLLLSSLSLFLLFLELFGLVSKPLSFQLFLLEPDLLGFGSSGLLFF